MIPSHYPRRNQSGKSPRFRGNSRHDALQQAIERLAARDEAQTATIRRLEQELAELRATLGSGSTEAAPTQTHAIFSATTKLPIVELVNGQTVARALYEDVRAKLAMLMKQHLRIVASKARNPSMVVSDRQGDVEFHVSERYGLGNHLLSHREAFHRLGLVDASGHMPEEIAAIVVATTNVKGNNFELNDCSTTEEVAAIETQLAEERRAEELELRAREDEEARRRERCWEEQQRLNRERDEATRRNRQQALDAQVAQERLGRQTRHRHRRRWIELRRWMRIQWQEFRRP